ncbi:MAG: hypothetical protein NTZ05_11795 [Chloroflexi bacterium]|nr:hypothetical protein [Chloroflexota bacterium]
MAFYLLYNFATKLGFPTVVITYLVLAVAHAAATPTPDLATAERVLSVLAGLGAVALSYRTLTVALPDCQLMALAASAFMAVLPGHVATVSVSPEIALAELVGAGLLFVAVRSVTRSAEARLRSGGARAPLAVAALGAAGAGVMAAALYGGGTALASAGAVPANATAATLETAIGGVGYFFATFWLPETWAVQPGVTWLAGVFGLGTLAAFGGAGLYWREMAHNTAGLTVPETAAFRVFYLVAGLGLVAGVIELLFSPTPTGSAMYPALASLALVGIVGYESWFPGLLRPLVVFAMLVFLLMVNIVGLMVL